MSPGCSQRSSCRSTLRNRRAERTRRCVQLLAPTASGASDRHSIRLFGEGPRPWRFHSSSGGLDMAHTYLGDGFGMHGEIDPDRDDRDRENDRREGGWRGRDEDRFDRDRGTVARSDRDRSGDWSGWRREEDGAHSRERSAFSSNPRRPLSKLARPPHGRARPRLCGLSAASGSSNFTAISTTGEAIAAKPRRQGRRDRRGKRAGADSRARRSPGRATPQVRSTRSHLGTNNSENRWRAGARSALNYAPSPSAASPLLPLPRGGEVGCGAYPSMITFEPILVSP